MDAWRVRIMPGAMRQPAGSPPHPSATSRSFESSPTVRPSAVIREKAEQDSVQERRDSCRQGEAVICGLPVTKMPHGRLSKYIG